MPFPLNDWHDWWRLILLLAAVYCNFRFSKLYRNRNTDWNEKTRDYWFVVTTWTLVGACICLEGMFRDREQTLELVYITAALIVTLVGMNRKDRTLGLSNL